MNERIEGLNSRLKTLFYQSDKPLNVIAKDFGVYPSAIQRWLNMNICPSPFYLKKICEYFNVSADWLLGLSNERNIA